jgi:hypothetical protein
VIPIVAGLTALFIAISPPADKLRVITGFVVAEPADIAKPLPTPIL